MQNTATTTLKSRAVPQSRFEALLAFIPFLAFFGWMVYKQRIGLLASGIAPGPDMLLATMGGLLIIAPWAFRAEGRRRILWAVLLDLVLTLILFADIVYYRQFGDLVSIASLRFVGQLSTVGDSVTALLKAQDIWLWADIPLIGALALLPRIELTGRLAWLRLDGLQRKAALYMAAAGAVIVGGVALLDPLLSAKYYGHSMVASRMGLINYHLFDMGTYAYRLSARAMPTGGAVDQVKAFFAPRRPAKPESAPLYGVAKGKNVIMIQWESMQAFPMHMVIDGQEVTPNLNRLARESLNFTDFYTQTGQGVTSDADLLANCSAYPTRTGAIYYDYAHNDFRCTPELLRENGYKAFAMQGMPADFWNLASVYPNVGFEKYYNLKDGLVEDEKIGIGLSDESFFRQTAAILKGLPQPYYSFVVSLTSHGPFDFEGLPHELKLGALEGTEAAHYLHAIHYTDKALGQFLDQLKQDGVLDHAVVMLYGDHAGIFRGNTGIPELLPIPEADEAGWTRMEKRVPFLIRLPGGAHAGEFKQAAGQSDIAPTLAGLLGVKTDSAFFMGRNLLAGEKGIVPFYTGSALNDELLFWSKDANPAMGQCFDRATGAEVDIAQCVPLAEEATRHLETSRLITTRDLIPDLLEHE